MNIIKKWADVPNVPAKNEVLLILQRHGESQGNLNKIMAGQTDLPLSERGVMQAKAACESLAERRIDAVYSSDLVRAYNTASMHAELRKIPTIADAGLREIHIGPWERRTKEELSSEYGEKFGYYFGDGFALYDFGGERAEVLPSDVKADINCIYKETDDFANDIANAKSSACASAESVKGNKCDKSDKDLCAACSRGETVIEAGMRFARTSLKIAKSNIGKTVLIGAHAGVIRAFFGLILGIAPYDIGREFPFAVNASFSYVLYKDGKFLPLIYSDYGHLSETGFLNTLKRNSR